MAISPFEAAKFVCGRGAWRVTNLSLQKILYLAHMVHMGRNGSRLINASFEAWEYGPVIPELYSKVKIFGIKPIQDIFHTQGVFESSEIEILNEACEHLLSKKPGELVAMTHWEHGAWAKNYKAGARGIEIPDVDIVNEYRARAAE